MRRQKLSKYLKNDFHFIWIILFFIIQGYNQQTQSIPFTELLLLFLILSGISALLFYLSLTFYKSFKKAGVFVSLILILVLFFGVFQDNIAKVRSIAYLSKLPVFLTIVLSVIVILLVWMKYTPRRFHRATVFINSLFLIYLCVEIFILFQSKHPRGQISKSQILSSCDTCWKPDVYLILLDEYFGSTGLKKFYGFDNSSFESSLKEKGFTVLSNTRSNYLLTVFSMASMLNMDYLRNRGEMNLKNHYAYKTSLSDLEANVVIEKFRTEGYHINNKSRFDMKSAPTDYSTGLLPAKVQLINSKTLYYRLAKNLPAFVAKKFRIRYWAKKIDDRAIKINKDIMDKVLTEASIKDSVPAFTYMHLHMPHEPFAFDSTGKRVIPFSQRNSFSSNDVDQAYLQYLVYTNKVISNYIDHLQKATNGNSVILLMSDHGFRFGSISDKKDMYQTLNAVYLPPVVLKSSKDIPDQARTRWYNGMTNVNQFRILFNILFDAKLPILKDSIDKNNQNNY